MKQAPYLLQAFAARVLAAKQDRALTRAGLVSQGYDVETLIDMIEDYNALPEADRGFNVTYTESEIRIQRKANAGPPVPGGDDSLRGTRQR